MKIAMIIAVALAACGVQNSVDELSQPTICLNCDPDPGGDEMPAVHLLVDPLPWSEPTSTPVGVGQQTDVHTEAEITQSVADLAGQLSWEFVDNAPFVNTGDITLQCGNNNSWIGCSVSWRWGRTVFEWVCWVKTAKFSAFCNGSGEAEQWTAPGQVGLRIKSINGSCGSGQLRC